MPFLAWLCGNWYVLGLITTAPGLLLVLYYKMVPESPRWLLSKNRLDEAEKVLLKIAETNGTLKNLKKIEISEYLLRLRSKAEESDKKYNGVWTLFTRKRVARNTILVSLVW
jgi:OCT family organic cation transporter-like MFS transporter 4/5